MTYGAVWGDSPALTNNQNYIDYEKELYRGNLCRYGNRVHVLDYLLTDTACTMTLNELNGVAYAIHTTKKKKGANKGYKTTYAMVWSDRMTRNEYLNELARIDPHECGLFLCKVEMNELLEDDWWNTPNYRATHLQTYRRKITELRKTYGLTSAEVSEFMRV